MVYVFFMTMIFPKSAPALAGRGALLRRRRRIPARARRGHFPAGAGALGHDRALRAQARHRSHQWLRARGQRSDRGALRRRRPRMLAMLGAFALVYFVYVAALRYLPRILATMLGALFLLLAVGALWKAAQSFHAGFLALPPASERGLDFLLDLIAWIAGEWVYLVALTGPYRRRRSRCSTRRRNRWPRAVWKIIADLLPPLILIFLVLGTIFQGIATPTEGGAMGAVGRAASGGGAAPAQFRPVAPGARADDQSLRLRRLHPDRRARLLAHLLWRRRAQMGGESAGQPARRPDRLPRLRQSARLRARLLPRFLRARLHHRAAARRPAEALGIDLIWFGVLLGINMQTSFMHPPFGFALFYLRSVAPREPYRDRVTGKTLEPVTTGQIYWGAVPFVIIQLIMVGLAIAFPADDHALQGHRPAIDPITSTIEITVPTDDNADRPRTGPPSFELRFRSLRLQAKERANGCSKLTAPSCAAAPS